MVRLRRMQLEGLSVDLVAKAAALAEAAPTWRGGA